MKVIALLFAALLASVSAGPTKVEDRFIDSIVAGILQNLSQQLQDLGLDPFEFTDDVELKLAVTDIFKLKAHIENFVMAGLSDIVLNRISYNVLSSTLTFDLAMPSIAFSVDSTNADVSLFGYRAVAGLSGSVDIVGSRVSGRARMNIGVITGTSIRDLKIDYRLTEIVSNVHLTVMDENYSDKVNEILGEIIPTTLHEYREDINHVLAHYIVHFFNNRNNNNDNNNDNNNTY